MSDPGAKYEALRLLLAGAATNAPANLDGVLEAVCRASGLSGAAIVLEPYEGEPRAVAGEAWAREALVTYGSDLWGQLAHKHRVESAYLQLNPDGQPRSLFAYPVYEGDAVVAAVMGIAEGRRNLALEEDFLVALATAVRLTRAIRPGPAAGAAAEGGDADAVQNARLAAILETAIAINHEVNNPLTAVLGNTQLLLMQAERLDPQLTKRLRDIEASALRIKDVTQRLLKQDGRTTDYPGGLRMLDLSDTSDREEPDGEKSG